MVNGRRRAFTYFQFEGYRRGLSHFIVVCLRALFDVFSSPIHFHGVGRRVCVLYNGIFFVCSVGTVFYLFSPAHLRHIRRKRHSLSLPSVITNQFTSVHFFRMIRSVVFSLRAMAWMFTRLATFFRRFAKYPNESKASLNADKGRRNHLFPCRLRVTKFISSTFFNHFRLLSLPFQGVTSRVKGGACSLRVAYLSEASRHNKGSVVTRWSEGTIVRCNVRKEGPTALFYLISRVVVGRYNDVGRFRRGDQVSHVVHCLPAYFDHRGCWWKTSVFSTHVRCLIGD